MSRYSMLVSIMSHFVAKIIGPYSDYFHYVFISKPLVTPYMYILANINNLWPMNLIILIVHVLASLFTPINYFYFNILAQISAQRTLAFYLIVNCDWFWHACTTIYRLPPSWKAKTLHKLIKWRPFNKNEWN